MGLGVTGTQAKRLGGAAPALQRLRGYSPPGDRQQHPAAGGLGEARRQLHGHRRPGHAEAGQLRSEQSCPEALSFPL